MISPKIKKPQEKQLLNMASTSPGRLALPLFSLQGKYLDVKIIIYEH